jgi:signal transduction histidine kinase/integral membrane sensor domain MASE1
MRLNTRDGAIPAVTRFPGFIAIAASTCAAYYAGSLVGLQLRLPPATTSILWPPNAVLTSALLLTPPRRWGWLLLSVLPVHVWIQLPTGRPVPMILSLFVTNSFEALLAAGGMHLLSDVPWRFDTARRLIVFLLTAALAAPCISSLADAAVVSWFRGEVYWHVWLARTPGNVLSELVVVPAAIGAAFAIVRLRRRHDVPRIVEASILGACIVAAGWLQLTTEMRTPLLGALSARTPLALQLPLILWAAVRFGPGGAGLALLTTSVLTAWAVVHQAGPFAALSPHTTVTAVTLSLILVAAALLSLATLIEERRHTQQALAQRLEFERLLSRLSGALVHRAGNQLHLAFHDWLGTICGALNFDAVMVFAVAPGSERLVPEFAWKARGAAAEAESRLLQWATLAVQAGERIDGGMPDAEWESGGALPLIVDGEGLGALAYGSKSDQPSLDLFANVRLLGELLGSALIRRRSEEALRASEVMKSAILQSLTAGVAVVDKHGRLLQANDQWARSLGSYPWMPLEVGSDLLAAWRDASLAGEALAADALAAVEGVLAGTRSRTVVEHPTGAGAEARWWSLTVVLLNRPEGGAVLICTDLTDLRRAEMEAQRSRQQLAHVGRVSTVGEMAASLAHQINQPLTAILANAQAARRMLKGDNPDYDAVKDILADIVFDNRRATDVVQHVRDLMRKGDFKMVRLSLPTLVREVLELTGSEAIIRNIQVSTEFAPGTHVVRADRVQMQQVILNLLHNAMDAIPDGAAPRRVVIACRTLDTRDVVLTVRDTGAGLPPGSEETVFDPFYTTKPDGMGLGLPIVRSIVEAHGGTVRARREGERGTSLEVTLPPARSAIGARQILSA